MSYHNVRDSKGRFTVATSKASVAVSSSAKDEVINKLKNGVYLTEYEKSGVHQSGYLTLMPSYLGNYVGKGNSKKAPSDLVFAYDIYDKRFKGVDINTIKTFEIC